jgi:hypothetical protein
VPQYPEHERHGAEHENSGGDSRDERLRPQNKRRGRSQQTDARQGRPDRYRGLSHVYNLRQPGVLLDGRVRVSRGWISPDARCLRGHAVAVMLTTIMLPVHVVIVRSTFFLGVRLAEHVPAAERAEAAGGRGVLRVPDGPVHPGHPRHLDDAAWTDGRGHGGIFPRTTLPLTTPALTTTAIFTFVRTWNDFFSQLIYLTAPDRYTVAVVLRSFMDATTCPSWGSMFAMSLVPVFLAFLIGQRYPVRGIATTGIK